jgi:hypothetical protein
VYLPGGLTALEGYIPMPRYRITITGSTEDTMADLIRRHNIRVFDHGVQRVPGRHVVHAVADDQEIRQLEAYGSGLSTSGCLLYIVAS